MTKTEAFYTGGLGLLAGAGLTLLYLLLQFEGFFPPVSQPPAGSPVVRGGSIRGLASQWKPCENGVCDSGTYWTTVNDNKTLIVSSVGNGIKSLPGLQGWTVNFYDRNNDGSVNEDPAVQLCSEKTCTASTPLDTNGYIYFRAPRSGDTLQVYSQGELRFHHRRGTDCDHDNSKEGYCDHVVLVGIYRNDGTTKTEVKYTCGKFFPGHCSVGFP